ncbi:hypothetical protein RvY_10756 [Ramazzottius varieornatus]|uniref:Uncharacterized protein n=1 Tax=Ramazzottius varieornatus TaxID=947166 RepID=A0A1D1VDT5_RAMVA|nr:hypothetical protein RvY_10756 [Ramazzottius varieornatus]
MENILTTQVSEDTDVPSVLHTHHQDIAITNTWMTALYDIYAPIFHTQGQAQLFRTNPSIINYFCDGTVTNVVYPEAAYPHYRGHLDLDPNINYTERYHHLLQYARPAHILRRGQQLVKAMTINTYLLPCLIIQPRETMMPEWHDLSAEFFTAFDMPEELLQLL